MAKRSSRRGRAGRSRSSKRAARSRGEAATAVVAAPAAGAPASATDAPRAPADGAGKRRRAARSGPSSRAGRAATRLGEQAALGERPQAPWHPLPLSELLIFVGLIGVIVGASRTSLVTVAAGVGAVCIGTFDFTIREHMSGYRPHTVLLAAVPTAVLHGAIAIALLAAHAPAPSWVVAPLVIDLPVFWVLYRILRARFRDARRERVFAASR